MKLKLITFVAVIAAGILVMFSVLSAQEKAANNYNNYLAVARENAEREIPYVAYTNYKRAMELQGGDEAVFLEYLSQAELLGKDKYSAAVEEYVMLYPNSANAYELYCNVLYDRGSYKELISNALIAREKGIATEKVKNYYLECCYMLTDIAYGFDEAQSFLGGYARVKIDENYGYIKQNGGYLIAAVYPGATMMFANAAVNDGEEWHIINTQGYKVARTSVPVDSIGAPVGNKISVSKDGKYGYTDPSLVIPAELTYEYASTFKNGIAAVKKGEKWALINTAEETITDYIFDDILLDEFDACYNGGVVFAKKDGKYYMVNSSGAKITDQAFDNAHPFAGNEPAAVCIGGKWGFVAADGRIIVEPQYEDARSFSVGLGGVCVDGKWGYINSDGSTRIEFQFEDCKPFSNNGIAAVKEEGVWRYVQLLAYRN